MSNTKMSLKERISAAPSKKWLRMTIMDILCLVFVVWSGYYLVLLLIPLFFDSYITRYIPWGFWKKSENKTVRKVMEWVDAIAFALIAVYIINTFFFQNYQIPTSSLEKSLLVGDFLFVSKMSYGSRSPMTPFSFPLAQHTLPFLNIKSYLDKPQVEYKRLTGFGSVKRGDIVVFNFPAGDTVAINVQAQDYYSLCKDNANGRAGVWTDKRTYGDIVYRPVDRRENYVKRCIGLPGETIELKDDDVFIDGKAIENPENIQHLYLVQTDGTKIASSVFDELGITEDDKARIKLLNSESDELRDSTTITQCGLKWNNGKMSQIYGEVFLTPKMLKELEAKAFVLATVKYNLFYKTLANIKNFGYNISIYPIDYEFNCSPGDFPALWIPKRGSTIKFDKDVDYKVAAYKRCIQNYEFNDFDYRDGKVFINGKEADSYTFKYDYYFMMGDNRDNSADSRAWGFVPEDHVVGKPMFVWLSLNKDKGWFSGKIRWDRLFTSAAK